jgi:zinc transporter ZupT
MLFFNLITIAFLVAIAGAIAGLWISLLPFGARVVIFCSGALLVCVAIFGLLPELIEETGWLRGVAAFAFCFLLTRWLDHRWGHHLHDHAVTEGGFAIPLLAAAAVHAFMDGWGLASSASGTSVGVRVAFPIAVVLHKAPEGLALGALFRTSTRSSLAAISLCLLAEAATFAGGWAAAYLTPKLGSAWTNYPLALAGGCFLYLGVHAVTHSGLFFNSPPPHSSS